VPVTDAEVIGTFDKGAIVLDAVLDAGRAVLAAELLGVAEESFERTLTYLREREQFGVKIGTFQALQHRAAHLFCEIELVRSVVLRTLQALDAQEPTAGSLVCLAKAKASEVARIATNEAVQMHGGIGMTDEFDIGFFMKRARAAAETFGDQYYHTDRFAQLSGY
jgi:acyl-CoA dehydrogenase